MEIATEVEATGVEATEEEATGVAVMDKAMVEKVRVFIVKGGCHEKPLFKSSVGMTYTYIRRCIYAPM